MTRSNALVIAGIGGMILLATLTASGSAPPLPFSYTLGGERRWLADGILNLVFFMPLGAAIAWNARRFWLATIAGLLLSTAVELAQTLIPGRDPALSDMLFNTAGAAAGALIGRHGKGWLIPDRRAATCLAATATALAGTVMIATVLLLAPAGPPSIGRSGTDLYLEYPTRGSMVGFDEPVYWLPRRLPIDHVPGAGHLSREGNRWRIVFPSGENATVGPTVGAGWTLLAFPDAIARRWGKALDACWMLALCFPIGLYARRARREVPTIAGLVIAGLLVLVPLITGSVATGPFEWLGAAAGFIGGGTAATRQTTLLQAVL